MLTKGAYVKGQMSAMGGWKRHSGPRRDRGQKAKAGSSRPVGRSPCPAERRPGLKAVREQWEMRSEGDLDIF